MGQSDKAFATGTRSLSKPVTMAGLGSILLLLTLAVAANYAVLEVKSGLRAYVTGESYWSKGRQQATYHLDRYAETGDGSHLRQAREGLSIPLGDLQARKALESSPPDLERARQGFLEGKNHPDDLNRLIWLFRFFSDTSHIRDAVEIWRETDPYLDRLEQLGGILATEPLSPERVTSLRNEINTINAELQELEMAFSLALGKADRWASRLLLVLVSLALVMTGIIAMRLFLRLARRMADSERELRATLKHAGVGMGRISRNGYIRSVNSRLCQTLGQPADKLIGSPLATIMSIRHDPQSGTGNLASIRQQLETGCPELILDRPWTHSDGRELWLRYTFSAVEQQGSHPSDYILVLEDLSEEQNRVEALTYEATHDALTGLINRREFKRRLGQLLETARSEHALHAVCFVDLDYFKDVNDTCGHAAGDECLIQLCDILRTQLRGGDVLARLGGDEFALILYYCPLDIAQGIAEQLRRKVSGFTFHWRDQTFHLSASIGLARLTGAHTDPERVLDAADHACYEAKREGRNSVFVMGLDDDTGESLNDTGFGSGIR